MTPRIRSVGRRLPVVGLAAFAAALITAPFPATAADLEGSWSGGGYIRFASGDRERARCRAQFSQVSSTVFRVNAVCATESVKVEQVARVRKVGSRTYAGRFVNSEYNITGDIRVTVKGSVQSVHLASGEHSANLTLYRR
jgi:hypothetical protein